MQATKVQGDFGLAFSRDAAWGVAWLARVMRDAQLGAQQAALIAALASDGGEVAREDLIERLPRNKNGGRVSRTHLSVVVSQTKNKLRRIGYDIESTGQSQRDLNPRYRLIVYSKVERAA